MNIINEKQLDFDDVLIRPSRSTLNSRSEVEVTRDFRFKYYSKTLTCTPIIASNMAVTGIFDVAKQLAKNKMLCALHKFYTDEEIENNLTEEERNYVFKSVGLKESISLPAGVDKIHVDVPNGYCPKLIDKVKEIRRQYSDNVLIMVGTVVTQSIAEDLIMNGADIVKIGLGNGSNCTTRRQTGVGRPTLSTIIECANAAHQLNAHLCSDGGCVYVGDIAKALGAGADFVMIGGMFAGTKEAGGKTYVKTVKCEPLYHEESGSICKYLTPEGKLSDEEVVTKKYKFCYGMSSRYANERFAGGMKNYKCAEGRELLIPYTGTMDEKIQEILGGLRSTCTYIGARKLKEMSKRTTFYLVNKQLNQCFEK